MRLFTAAQMRLADALAVEAGISLSQLMDNAGRAVAGAALQLFPEANCFVVLCGKGNNGGDGYVAARYLYEAQKEVLVLEQITALETLTTEEARQARASYIQFQEGYPLNAETLNAFLARGEVIIDALLGSGLSSVLHEPLSSIVARVNQSGKPVLSIDVPSGVFSDSPLCSGPHIQATHTVQLAGPKLASAFYPARKAFGHWSVADIGIPETIVATLSQVQLLDDALVRSWLPQPDPNANKYTAGTVLVIAGSSRYLGAAELACRAAYRSGAGLVTLAAGARLPSSWPEIIFETLDWSQQPLETLKTIGSRRAQSRVIGPGLDAEAQPYLPELILQSSVPTVLDAGALHPGEDWTRAVRDHGNCVLTPHYGEAARLLGISSAAIQEHPLNAASQLAQHLQALIVLKGPSTVITDGGSFVAVSTRGHAGMATGGTGDVLAGCIGAMLAKTSMPIQAVAAAVYMHGLAGERAAQNYQYGLVASDLITELPKLWRELG